MGAGASMEEDYTHSHPPEAVDPQGSVVGPPQGPRAPRSRPTSRPLSRTGSNASGQWRAALRTANISHPKLRKMRAAALGRKSACTVTVDKTGFSLQHIQICEGQVVSFQWSDEESKGYNVTQVCHDGDQYKPVVGGYNSGPITRKGYFEQQFNLQGEYKFVSAGLRCTPLTVEVYHRKDIEAELTDEGFTPQLIRIDEGTAIRWSWSACDIPHSLIEVKYAHKTGTLVQKDTDNRPIPTKAGSSRKEFKKVGLYYYQSEGIVSGEMHSTMVHVRERQFEYRVEVQDRSFDPPILVIQEGDRVWFWWDKARGKKLHCPYQIDLPEIDHPSDESYQPKKGGFKWPSPSKSGLLSQEFFEAGIYHFSDHNFDEAAEYIGTIIVKPKQREHFVELSPDGFSPDVLYAESGDRVWWDWVSDDLDSNFAILEVDKCISPVGGRPAIENEAAGEGSYTDEPFEKLKCVTGVETTQLGSTGVYHYKVAQSGRNISTCSIITKAGSKNHTVHVTDTAFEPKVVTIHPGDRIWWVWQEGSKEHNIVQVSHQGNRITDGFCSGAPIDCPSAYMVQFKRPGVYYYISDALSKLFGAVVVTSQPTVHEIQCTASSIIPDPLPINLNDVVAWTFRGLRQNDLCQVASVDQVLDAQTTGPSLLPPRRCISRLFTERGVYHYASKAFSGKHGDKTRGGGGGAHNSDKALSGVEDDKISSVLVDELSDSAVVRVDAQGFHPQHTTIKKGMSVLWTWKDSKEEAHNIIHVNTPDSETPLSVIEGGRSFNSGRPTPDNSFLYTFDEPGGYCVASQGAPGFAGQIKILDSEERVEEPQIISDVKGGPVDKFHIVHLKCPTSDTVLYYTVDGSVPELHRLNTKRYEPDKGVVLRSSGLGFVRCIATKEGLLSSQVCTSKRFWILSGEDDRSSPEPPQDQPVDNTRQVHWWNCVPQIHAVFTKPGVMEVFWDGPEADSRHMVKGYQLTLNGVVYCEEIPPSHTTVTVAGLAGGRGYEVMLEAYPTDSMFLPHKSNKLMMNSAKTTNTSGPVISLETTDKPDTMTIVWMSISTDTNPIEGYRVYFNGQMCGPQVVPDPDSERCKVVIEGCQLDFVYRVVVAAVPTDGGSPKMSNEMEVMLPLDTTYIRLPEAQLRTADDDLYKEYVEIQETGEDREERRLKRRNANLVLGTNLQTSSEDETSSSSDDDDQQSLDSDGKAKKDKRKKKLKHRKLKKINQPDDENKPETSGTTSNMSRSESTETKDPNNEQDEKKRRRDKSRKARSSTKKLPGDPQDDSKSDGSASSSETSESGSSESTESGKNGRRSRRSRRREKDRKSRSKSKKNSSRSKSRTKSDSDEDGDRSHRPKSRRSRRKKHKRSRDRSARSTDSRGDKVEKETMTDFSDYSRTPRSDSSRSTSDQSDTASEASRDPWQNKMKTVANSIRATKRMRPKPPPKRGDNVRTRVLPGNIQSYEVEIQEQLHQDMYKELRKPSIGIEDRGKRGPRTAKLEIPVDAEAHVTVPEVVPVTNAPNMEATEDHLPVPLVEVSGRGVDKAAVSWRYERSAEPLYRLLVNVVNVVGPAFSKDVNSNISFECLQEDSDGTANSAIQHCWNVLHTRECVINGLLPGMDYNIYVVATYALVQSQQPCEIQAKSQVLRYTTLGPPDAPTLRILDADLHQVTLAWDVPTAHKDIEVLGFQVLIDGQALGGTLNKTVRQTIIDNLQPGRTIRVSVVTLTNHPVGNSVPSNVINVACPHKPATPIVTQQPSYKKGSVIVAWDKPAGTEHASYGEDIILYKVYIDGQYQGEVTATTTCDKSGYQYYVTNLSPGQAYDINIRSYSGQQKTDPTSSRVFCVCESDLSNTMPVMCPAPPTSPHLRLEGMHGEGVDVTWEMPQQYGDAAVSGYQMLKDGRVYGSIIPPDVHSLRIKGMSLGDRVELQILALTDHPVGRGGDGEVEGNMRTQESGLTEVYLGDRYSACSPGPKLLVHYTGLVEPPEKVWCERVTGHSAMIVWSKDQRGRQHFVPAESYQVTWWPGVKAENDVNSHQTKDDHLQITGLRTNTTYTVVVEARNIQKYSGMDEGSHQGDDYLSSFILTAKSDNLTIQTASPPKAPSNVGVMATTCHSVQVSWDPPQERGVDIVGIRVDAVTVKSNDRNKHSCVEVLPTENSAIVENLSEKTEYLLTITAITDEYFDQLPPGHELKTTRILPRDKVPREDSWLPSTSVISMTSGTDAPSDITVKKTTVNSVSLKWTPAVVYGSNRLQGTVVRWAEGKFKTQFRDETGMASHRSILAESNEVKVEDLQPGILYKFVVEAVVSVKTTLENNSRDADQEKKNRRTTHVMSRPVLVRTRAPCEPPRPIITGFSTKTIQLYWEKPLLYSVIGRNQDDSPKYLKLSLEGYRLMINDKPHMRLGSSAQSCTLVKCKPGKTYKIVLVACTCTEEVKKERKRKRGPGPGSSALDESFTTSGSNHTWHTDNEDFENDESPSEPIEVTLPNLLDGQLSELSASYLMPSTNLEAPQDHKDCGDLQIDWGLQQPDLVKQVKVVWQCPGASQSKVVDPDVKNTTVPIDKDRRVYDVLVTPEHTKDVTPVTPQRAQVLVPGSPDAPEIWTRSVDDGEFVIEWGQPRCYGVKIGGYQVYMNGKKVGNQLSSHHRKAVVPCKPKRQYRVNLVAVSADNRFSNSEQSNLLLINTGSKYGSTLLRTQTATMADDGNHGDHPEDDYNIRVVRVTEATIHLDWGQYTEPQGIAYYRVVWSSVAQTAEREVKLPAGEKSCVIHKCYPGTNHFLRLYTMGTDDAILDKSRMLTVQTSAPPDPPNVRVRACNFKYIAIQWDKPTSYGDAKITGYKIYVNGVVEALQGAEQFTYSHTQGQWCKEYVFQVQALTATDKLSSKPSEPLVVTWPGISPPSLRRAPSVSTNAVKVVWDLPASTDGVKVKQFKVVVLEEVSEKVVQIISPIHPGTSEADIHNLRQGKYLVYLEVHVHGSTDVVKSDVLRVEPCLSPNPPAINVTVIGLEERRAIEKITCQLVNKRDRLLNVLGSKEMAGSPRYNDNEQALVKAAEALTRIEDMLDDCLHSLDHYTGHLMAHVSWTCPQSSDDITVSGYKVLVDGKQYGTTLHNGIKSIRVKLGLDAPSHKISMVSVSEHPHTTSAPSNGVEVITEPFLPFSFFTFFSQIKMKNSLGPLYSAALTIERRQLRRPVNQGLLRRHIPPPFCSLMDLVQGQYRPLFPPSGPRTLTAVLFWSKWCPYSTKTLSWFVRLARSLSSQYEFVAVACEPREITAEIRQDLLTAVTDSGWREDSAIRHVLSQCQAEGVTLSPGRTNEINGGEKGMEETQNGFGDKYTAYIDMNASYSKDRKESVKSSDVTELFGVLGVPSLVVIHPQDYIAWKGRYCAFDYASFEYFTNYVFGQVLGNSTPMADPWDADIDTEALNGARKARPADKDLLIHRPTSSHGPLKTNYSTGSKTTIHVNGNHGNARPVSAVNTRPVSGKKKLFHKSKAADKITVNSRPFSATVDSPYAQRVRTASPPRRAKSGRKHKTAYY